MAPKKQYNISHKTNEQSLESALIDLKKKIIDRGNLPHISTHEQLDILQKLATFALGRFLIIHKGLNGFWTDYIVHKGCLHKDRSEFSPKKPDLEEIILERFPSVLATQERYKKFKEILQKNIGNKMSICSIPSGIMGELVELNYSNINACHIVGVDLDKDSLLRAKKNIESIIRSDLVIDLELIEENAWDLNITQNFDIVISNGLNIYEKDDLKVIELYKLFKRLLSPKGILITSFLTPNPSSTNCEWNFNHIKKEDALMQKIVFSDILNVSWQACRTQDQTIKQLKTAGFVNIDIHPDAATIFPTVTAKAF